LGRGRQGSDAPILTYFDLECSINFDREWLFEIGSRLTRLPLICSTPLAILSPVLVESTTVDGSELAGEPRPGPLTFASPFLLIVIAQIASRAIAP